MPSKITYKAGDVVNGSVYISDSESVVGASGHKTYMGIWKCKWCNTHFKTANDRIRSGHTTSCGCLWHKSPANYSHGLRNHPIYKKWSSIKNRCLNPNEPAYRRYGGRGIAVYEPWIHDFKAFYDHLTSLKLYDENNIGIYGLTIDRIDNDGNYEPGNLRWATREIQARNRIDPKRSTIGSPGTKQQPNGKWLALIYYKRKGVHLGTYISYKKASEARDEFIIINKMIGKKLYSKKYGPGIYSS